MNRHRLVLLAAAGCVALGVIPAAAVAENALFPPGTNGPIGSPTNAQDLDLTPFAHFVQQDNLYHVLDVDDNVIGQFTNTSTFFVSPYPIIALGLPALMYTNDVISDSTYPDLPDGSVEQSADLAIWLLTSPVAPIGHFYYLNIPDVITESTFSFLGFGNQYLSDETGISDIVTLFGQSFTLFDIPAPAAAEAADWLTDLNAVLDTGALF